MDNNFNSNNNMNNYNSNNYFNPNVGNNDWDPEATVRMTPEMANQHINNIQNPQWNQEISDNQAYMNNSNMMYNQDSVYAQDSVYGQDSMYNQGMLYNQNGFNDQNMVVNRIVQPIVPKKKMAKGLKIALTAIISIIVLAGIVLGIMLFRAKNNMPNDEYYIANIPKELLTYMIDNEEYTDQIAEIKIENKKSSLFKETVDCTFIFQNDQISRAITCSFESKRNLVSKWKSEVTTDYQTAKIDFTEGFFESALSKKGYNVEKIDNISVDEKTGDYHFLCQTLDTYSACEVNSVLDFKEESEAKLENGVLTYDVIYKLVSSESHCNWNIPEGAYKQETEGEAELSLDVSSGKDSLIFDFTTVEFGNQQIEYPIYERFDDKGKPYMNISQNVTGKDRRGNTVNLTYAIDITADGIDKVSVKDSNNTYYSCGLELGSTTIEETQVVEAGGHEFVINKKTISITVTNDESAAAVEFFLEKYPQFKELVHVDGPDMYIEKESAIKDKLNSDAGSRPDVLVVSADNLWNMGIIDNEHVVPLESIGIESGMYSNAYNSAIEYGTYDDELKAMTWTLSPGYFYYKKDIAKKVLGTDDPDKVQAMISDWDKFLKVAEKMKKKGYKMIPSEEIVEQPILRARENTWVENGKFQADDSIKKAIDIQYKLKTKGYTAGCKVGDGYWKKSFADKKIFGDFSATRFTNKYDKNTKYGMCMGPSAFCWGGNTYTCVTDTCENQGLAALMLYTLCCDKTMMEKLIKSDYYKKDSKDTTFVLNNKEVMASYIEAGTSINHDYFSNQNEYKVIENILNYAKEGKYKTRYDNYILTSVINNTRRYISKELKNVDKVVAEITKDTKDKYGLD